MSEGNKNQGGSNQKGLSSEINKSNEQFQKRSGSNGRVTTTNSTSSPGHKK